MKVTVEIPDEIVEQFLNEDREVDEALVEAILVSQESDPCPEVIDWIHEKHEEKFTE